MRMRTTTLILLAAVLVALAALRPGAPAADAADEVASPADASPGEGWSRLEPGLELGVFTAPVPAASGESRIRVLRVDVRRWELVLCNTSAPGEGELHSAREWCRRRGLAAAINAGMFQADGQTGVSLMRTRDHVNNPRLSRDNSVLAFDAGDAALPPVTLIDRQCDDFEALAEGYGTLVQGIRMVSCRGNNVWAPQERRYSTAALAVDGAGRVLLIHCRSPYSTHDLIENLLALPLDIARAMYLEGGPQAQLAVEAGGRSLEFVGSYRTGLLESDLNTIGWPVPNVLGVARRKAIQQGGGEQ